MQASTFIKPNIPADPAVSTGPEPGFGGVITPTSDAACDALVRITWGYPTGPICAEGVPPITLTVGEHALSAVLSGSQVTFLGRNPEGYIYARETAAGGFGPWVAVQNGPTKGRPEVVDRYGELYLFFRDAEGGISYKRRIAGIWEFTRTIIATAATSSPVAGVDADGDVIVAYMNAGDDLNYSRFSGGSWTSGTIALPYYLTGQLAAAVYSGNVYVFGLDKNGYMWVNRWFSSLDSWIGWYCLCGTLSRGPSAVAYGGDLYVFGLDVGGGSWYRKLSGGDWGAWMNLGGVLASAHGSTSPTGAVLFTGMDILGGSWTRILQSPGSFGPWTNLGGVVMTGQELAPAGSSAYMVTIDSVGQSWYMRWDGAAWDNWANLGGILQSE